MCQPYTCESFTKSGRPDESVHSLATRHRKLVKKASGNDRKYSASVVRMFVPTSSLKTSATTYKNKAMSTCDQSKALKPPSAPSSIIVSSVNMGNRAMRKTRAILNKRKMRMANRTKADLSDFVALSKTSINISARAKTTSTRSRVLDTHASPKKSCRAPSLRHFTVNSAVKIVAKMMSMTSHPRQSRSHSALKPTDMVLRTTMMPIIASIFALRVAAHQPWQRHSFRNQGTPLEEVP
mmetsp:Transcript_29344/g.85143  ORF Transcript_29344/g.85143 Transcript_29344/m.85143 type:complete len:238 (+) Transcript_29344:191-904(+)